MQASQLIAEILRAKSDVPTGPVLLSEIDGWDSLKGVRLVLRIEEVIGRELTEDDIETLRTVEDVDQLLKT